MSDTGIVFNIQRFSTHDGPGIRTTVFLKGCPLTCQWCSNPESQLHEPQLMIRDSKCTGCGACISVCPEQALYLSDDGRRKVRWDKCTHCLLCTDVCIYQAQLVSGKCMTVDDVVAEVEKDRVFYRNGKGGVTFSGGEALSQHQFLEQLLIRLCDSGIHRTLDTTAFATEHILKRIIPLTNLVMVDIKHLDSVKHKQGTGAGNRQVLKNISYIAASVKTWFRIPLIPGYNDDEDHIASVARLAADLGVEKISLLPYHEGGRSKAAQTGMRYTLPEMKTQSDDELERLAAIIATNNIRVSVAC